MTTLSINNSISRSPLRLAFLLIPLALACFALSPRAQATDLGGVLPNKNTADGVGVLTHITLCSDNSGFGFKALEFNQTGTDNTATGFQALLNNTIGGDNTANGSMALENNRNGGSNTATGFRALMNNVSGSANTANGLDALRLNTNGNFNTATGHSALLKNTASDNTATGYQALYSNTSGSSNTANGLNALYNNNGVENTATGVQALYSNTVGNWNTATGVNALRFNTSGQYNSANGIYALQFNTSGSNNTAEGAAALFSNTTGSNNIALGVEAGLLTTGSNNIDIGDLGGGGPPTIRIGVQGTQTAAYIAGIFSGMVGANNLPVIVDSNGQLGTAVSSERFKKDIKPMEGASQSILALKPVSFHYKSDTTNTPQFGLVAEQVAKVNPDLVVRDKNGEIYTVRYDVVNAMLLNEFLKEHSTVQELKKEIAALTATVTEQSAKIQKVSAQLEASKPAPQMVNNP